VIAELRPALLGERARAFTRVLAGEHRHAQARLLGERLVLGQALGFPDDPQDGAHRDRPVGRDRLRDLQRLAQCLAVRHDVADQPDRQRLGRGDVPAGEQQVGRYRVRDLPGQPDRRTAQREQPPPCLGDAEPRALPGHPDVARLQDLGAARDRRALHRGDQRLGQAAPLEQRLDHRQVQVTHSRTGVVAGHGHQVRARAERPARPGQHADPDAGIGVGQVPGLAHHGHHRAGQRVARLRPVHRDDQHVPAALDEGVRLPLTGIVDGGRGHGNPPFPGIRKACPRQ